MRIYDVVNVDRVKRYVPSVGEWPGRTQLSRPPPVIVGDDGVESWRWRPFSVRRRASSIPPLPMAFLTRDAGDNVVVRYLVQWIGYSMDDCSWEPASGLVSASDLVTDYERRL